MANVECISANIMANESKGNVCLSARYKTDLNILMFLGDADK